MNNRLLVIDDNLITRTILAGLFKAEYDVVQASNGLEGINYLLAAPTSYCAILLDLNMPIMDGYKFIDKMKELNLLSSIPVIVVTAENSDAVETKVLEMGVSDIVNSPIVPKTVFCRVQNAISANYYRQNLEKTTKNLSSRLRKSNEIMIETLSSIIEHRSLESGQHIKRIRSFTEILLNQIAKTHPKYGLDNKTIQCIASASTLHDVGKIVIPDSILNKPGRLTKEEFETMKTHTVEGGNIIKKLKFLDQKDYLEYAYQIAMFHHERYDGKGYPYGLVGEDIPLCAQVAAIADVYDALTTPRVYKPAFSHDQTVRMIISGECGVFSEIIKQSFRLVAYQFEEKARQYRDGEINLEEFGFDMEENLLGDDSSSYIDSYRYKGMIKELGDIVLEIDYNTKEYTVLHHTVADLEKLALFGNITTDIPTFVDKLVHPEDCMKLLEQATLAKNDIERQKFDSKNIFVRLKLGKNKNYEWYEIKQVKLNSPDSKNIRTLVIFKNVEIYAHQNFEKFEDNTILKLEDINQTEKSEKQKDSEDIFDIGLTSDMIYEMFRSACDILYILNLDNGKAIFDYKNEDDFTTKVPENINDFVTDRCIKIHEEDKEQALNVASLAAHSNEEVSNEFRMLSKSGEYKKYRQRIVPIRGAAGNVSHLVGFINHKDA